MVFYVNVLLLILVVPTIWLLYDEIKPVQGLTCWKCDNPMFLPAKKLENGDPIIDVCGISNSGKSVDCDEEDGVCFIFISYRVHSKTIDYIRKGCSKSTKLGNQTVQCDPPEPDELMGFKQTCVCIGEDDCNKVSILNQTSGGIPEPRDSQYFNASHKTSVTFFMLIIIIPVWWLVVQLNS